MKSRNFESKNLAETLSKPKVEGNYIQTKSSLPGLWNYTGERNVLSQNSYRWLEAKRRDDNIGNYWRVHDKLYDLEKFIPKHPGGSDWIELTRGTDVTEAFETSHLINTDSVYKILEKYYVKKADTPRNSPYTFHQNGFYKTLKRRIEPVLMKVGTDPTDSVKYFQDTLALLFILLGVLGAYTESIGVVVLAGIILDMSTTSAHNFFHIRDNWRQYYFDLSLMSSYEWKTSHTLSHHMYTNTLLDLEITMAEPILMFLPTQSKSWLQRYGVFIYGHLAYFLGSITAFAQRTIDSVILRKYKVRPENFIPLLELALFSCFAPSLWSGCKTWLLLHGVSAYGLILVGFVAGHHHPDSFHDGDEARVDPDFGLCQLDATKSKADSVSDNLFVNLVTFGDHPLHHLFPSICHSKLHHIRPILEATLKEFGEKNQALSQWELFIGLNKQYARITPNPRRHQLSASTMTTTTSPTTQKYSSTHSSSSPRGGAESQMDSNSWKLNSVPQG